MSQQKQAALHGFSIVGLVFWLLYAWACFDPEPWWGFHYIAFLPPVLKYGFLLGSLALLGWFSIKPFNLDEAGFQRLFLGQSKWLIVLVTAVIFGGLYHNFPMYKSLLGDAELFAEKLGERTTESDPKYTANLFTPNILSPKNGNLTVLSAVRLVSVKTGWTHTEVYRLMDALFGMLFVAIWLLLVNAMLDNVRLKILLMVAGITAPFTQFYFGYEEIYAPAFTGTLGYLAALMAWFRTRKQWLLWTLLPLLFLALKFHSASFLLLPSFGMAIAWQLWSDKPWLQKLFTWKMVSLLVLLPAVAGGAFVYFVVLESHIDPRFLNQDVDIYKRLFLPLFAPEPPLDRYTLLHPNHLHDYFNLWFLWSGTMVFALIGIAAFYRKQIDWNRPLVVITGLTLLFYAMLYFVVNPLMSMPVDCDYFSLPGPVLSCFVLVLLVQLQRTDVAQKMAGGVLALSLLSVPVFMTNAGKESLSNRMETVGIHVFKTYWIRSAGDIGGGIDLMAEDPAQVKSRYANVLLRLQPHALPGNDTEYANLLWRLGKHYRTVDKDYETALSYHEQALQYDRELADNYIGLMEANYFLGRYDKAYEYSLKLIEYGKPGANQSYRIAIDCAIKAGFTAQAIQHCDEFLQRWDDDNIRNLRKQLSEN